MSGYPYIRVWGEMMGSLEFFIDLQQQQAQTDSAPTNAIYKYDEPDQEPFWATTEDILAANMRHRFERECERLKVPSPWAGQAF